MTKSILFIGKNQALEREFQAYARNPDAKWGVTFAATDHEALSLCIQHGFAAVVAEARSGTFDALELLDTIMQRQPEVLRVIVSDVDDKQNTLKCIGKGHHHLLGPCELRTLLQTLEQPYRCGTWRPSKAVLELTGQMRRLPSPPKIYFQVLSELQAPDPWVERIGELIAQDPAVAAKVLQFANSAAFGLQMQVTHPREAVSYIGLEATQALVLMAHTFSAFDRIDLDRFSLDALWRHSVSVGRFARRIARLESHEPLQEEQSFTAGLLHDIGQLLFAANLPKPFGQAVALASDEGRGLWETETQLFGASHAELGACLLGTWGLPGPIVDVALHHCPGQSKDESFSALTAVHAANVLSHEAFPGTSKPNPQLDQEYLKRLNLKQGAEDWRRNCLETSRKDNS